MGTHIGNEGQVKLGTNAVGEVTGFQITESAAVADDSALGDAWDTHLVGSKSWSAQIDAHWDDADTNGQDVLVIGASIALLNLYLEGSATGDTYFNGAGTVTQITRQVSRNQTISASFQVQGNGALSKSTVPA
jgi:alpha-D-ribose 1-methylphosphonate 5-triphosphate synthase subunit PhnG